MTPPRAQRHGGACGRAAEEHQRGIVQLKPGLAPRRFDRSWRRPSSYSAVIGEGLRALVQSSGDLAGQAFSNALLKRDLAAGTVQAHQFGRDPTVGETVFAPATPTPPKTTAALWPSSNPNRSAADLVILAVQDFSGQPVACVRMLARSRPASTAAGSPTSKSR